MTQKASKRQTLKNVTLRFDKEAYELLVKAAKADNRSLANFIETITLRAMQTDPIETEQILSDRNLLREMKQAKCNIKRGRGRYV